VSDVRCELQVINLAGRQDVKGVLCRFQHKGSLKRVIRARVRPNELASGDLTDLQVLSGGIRTARRICLSREFFFGSIQVTFIIATGGHSDDGRH